MSGEPAETIAVAAIGFADGQEQADDLTVLRVLRLPMEAEAVAGQVAVRSRRPR